MVRKALQAVRKAQSAETLCFIGFAQFGLAQYCHEPCSMLSRTHKPHSKSLWKGCDFHSKPIQKTFNGYLQDKKNNPIKNGADLILASNVFAHSDDLKTMAESMRELIKELGLYPGNHPKNVLRLLDKFHDDLHNNKQFGWPKSRNTLAEMGFYDGRLTSIKTAAGRIEFARAYVRALGGFATSIGAAGVNSQGTQWYNAGGQLSFDGVKIFVANGLADDTAMAAQKSNLYFGTGLLNDMNEVKVLDMADLDGSQNVRVVLRFTAGIQVGFGSDVVLYHPTV